VPPAARSPRSRPPSAFLPPGGAAGRRLGHPALQGGGQVAVTSLCSGPLVGLGRLREALWPTCLLEPRKTTIDKGRPGESASSCRFASEVEWRDSGAGCTAPAAPSGSDLDSSRITDGCRSTLWQQLHRYWLSLLSLSISRCAFGSSSAYPCAASLCQAKATLRGAQTAVGKFSRNFRRELRFSYSGMRTSLITWQSCFVSNAFYSLLCTSQIP
jgi:hypothetical protein